MSASPAPVLFETLTATNGRLIGIARLNAEKSLNSLTLDMIDLLWERFSAWANDPAIAAVMLEGAGERAFCAGADLHRLHASILEHRASAARDDIRTNAYALDFFTREYRLDYLLHTYPKPLIAWGHGVVMGGGMGLLVGASHRVVTEQVRIAMPEINIGLYADVAGSWFLRRTPGRTGIFLALTAAQLGAQDALFAGLADFQVLHARKAEFLDRLKSCDWQDNATANRRQLTKLLTALAERVGSPGPLRTNFDLINDLCASDDPHEVVTRITTLRSDDAWMTRAAATLAAGSPTTAILSIELQRRLQLCSLAEVFRAELTASLMCAARPDLVEGIRALLIDKDKNPRWQPAQVSAVTPAWIDAYFKSPWAAENHPLRELGFTAHST